MRILSTAFAFSCAALSAQIAVPTAPKSVDPPVLGWPGYGRDPWHNATWNNSAQTLNRILWQAPVDLQPQYSGPYLLIHYGTPLCTASGTVVLTVKTGATDGFQCEGRNSKNGNLLWTLPTDYSLPAHGWTPSCGSTLTPANSLVVPAAGGTVLIRSNADSPAGTVRRVAFYGLANYQANQATYNSNVLIDTPITCDTAGNLFFGFVVVGPTPLNLQSGIARIAANGTGSWTPATAAANDPAMAKVVLNCAPALSRDQSSLYVGITDNGSSGFGTGYLVRVNAQTLAFQSRVRVKDVMNPGNDAYLADDGTASPMVGPDGDVFFGVLENPFGYNHLRGWMLHFDATLAQTKLPGAFGWDDTGSVVPRAAVPSYTGPSSYLVLTKYNNYGGGPGGNGQNKVAVLDPATAMVDTVSGATVMAEVLTVVGPTPDPNVPGGVTEWCINTAAVDPLGRAAFVNNEDGKLYRWDFVTNTLTQTVTLTSGLGEAYTSTIICPNGIVLAINNATVFAVGA